MFDSHIQYYAFANLNGDKKSIGLLGNKKFWLKLMNSWNKDDGIKRKYVAEEWEELKPRKDFRGNTFAEVEPMDDKFLVTWWVKDDELCVVIDENNQPHWQCNPKNFTDFPQWLKPLRRALKSTK